MDAGDKVDISNFYLILHFALKRIIFDMEGAISMTNAYRVAEGIL